jgi:alkylhydroperoxidase family enzyme
MPRVRLVPRSEITDEFVLDRWQATFGDADPATDASGVGPNGTRGDYWAAIANAPATVRWVWDGFTYLHGQALSGAHREIAMARAGWNVGSKFVYSQHCKGLRAQGWSEDKIAAVPYWQTAACFDATERLLFAFADDLVLQHGRVPPQRYDELHGVLSDQEIVEFVHATLIYMAHATVCRALGVEFDDVVERVSEVGGGNYGLGQEQRP